MSNDEVIQKALDILGEHFDHVQILVTWNEDALSKFWHRGSGSWYARQGMAHEFINSDIAQDAARQIAAAIRPEEE